MLAGAPSTKLTVCFVLLAFYATGIHRSLDALPADGDASGGAKAVAAVSLFAWIMVIVMGRFIMYNDTLLYALGM